MENFKQPKVPAFKEDLVRSKYDTVTIYINDREAKMDRDRLFEFVNSNDYIVRKILRESDHNIEDAILFKKLFIELREKYNIHAPVQFIVAKDTEDSENKDSVFAITEHVVKADLDITKEKKVLKEFVELWESLLKYYEDKSTTKDIYLQDLSDIRQYVYGKKKDDDNARWYLVDTDAFTSKANESLFDDVDRFVEEIKQVEQFVGHPLPDLTTRAISLFKKLAPSEDEE